MQVIEELVRAEFSDDRESFETHMASLRERLELFEEDKIRQFADETRLSEAIDSRRRFVTSE